MTTISTASLPLVEPAPCHACGQPATHLLEVTDDQMGYSKAVEICDAHAQDRLVLHIGNRRILTVDFVAPTSAA